jgi:hypothetical protein
VETVLRDMLEEQKITSQLNQDLAEKISKLDNKVETFNQKLEQQQVVAPPADVKPIEEAVIHHFNHFCEILNNQPKSVIRRVRLLLFPETNAGHYYKIVFGRLMPWVLVLILATYGFSLGKQFIEKWSVNNERERESDQCLKAWNYLYDHEKAEGKKRMLDAWNKTWNGGK